MIDKQIKIKKLTLSELKLLDISDGFTRWSDSNEKKGKIMFRKIMRQSLKKGDDVFIVVKENIIIGFTTISDWKILPDAKTIDAIEIAKPYRRKGIGTKLLKTIVDNWDTLIALMPSSEKGREVDLKRFYKNFRFIEFIQGIMILLPNNRDKLKKIMFDLERIIYLCKSLLEKISDYHQKEL